MSGTIQARTPPATGSGSVGLQLLRSLIDRQARTEFRQITQTLFTAEERPALQFVTQFYRLHGQLPTPDACAENGHRLPAAANPPGYYIERARARAGYNTILSEQPLLARAMAARDMGAVQEVISRLHSSMGQLQATQDTFTLNETVALVLEEYERAAANPGIQGITLGWAYMDEMTGGAEGGDVVTWVARPGQGKSYLLTSSARRAWLDGEGHSVLYVTNEMTHVQTARRFLGIHAGVNPDYIRRGQLSTWGRDAVYESATSIATNAPFHLISGAFQKSVAAVDAAIQEFSPDVVYIDASYLMKPAAPGEWGKKGQWELLAQVGQDIKTMAMTRGKPVIQTVQFNRSAKKTNGGQDNDIANIAGTDVIGQISTIVVAIGEGEAPFERTRRKLAIKKNREGESEAEMNINFLFNPPNFDFIPTDENGQTVQQDPTADEWEV